MERVNKKILALAKFLCLEKDELDEINEVYDDVFEHGSDQYLVLDDNEANDKVAEYIEESVWTFNIRFLSSYLPKETQKHAKTILQPLVEMCEDGNDAIKALINWDESKKDFINEAVSSDGRGHFLANYDGEENEVKINDEYFYIYRFN